jgi:hypothetical protein
MDVIEVVKISSWNYVSPEVFFYICSSRVNKCNDDSIHISLGYHGQPYFFTRVTYGGEEGSVYVWTGGSKLNKQDHYVDLGMGAIP